MIAVVGFESSRLYVVQRVKSRKEAAALFEKLRREFGPLCVLPRVLTRRQAMREKRPDGTYYFGGRVRGRWEWTGPIFRFVQPEQTRIAATPGSPMAGPLFGSR